MTTSINTSRLRNLAPHAPLAVLAACLLWAYWPTLLEMSFTWYANPQYQHGFLVPVFAGFLLYMRREKLDIAAMKPSLWGLALVAIGLGMRLYGVYGYFVSLDGISFLPVVAGLVLVVGGLAAWRWAWPAVLFLGFMIPLPYFAAVAMSGPLQRLATVTSTYVMQTFGLPALAEGNVIMLNEHRIGIVEACSGLRMLVVFFALSTAVVLGSKRHWIDRCLILASAIPIALISNIIRVTTTGLMYNLGYSELASHFFHDVAGYLMMPIGLGLLWVELAVLSRLFVDMPAPAARTQTPVRRAAPAAVRPAPKRPRRAATNRDQRTAPVEQPIQVTANGSEQR
jgi:exosortase